MRTSKRAIFSLLLIASGGRSFNAQTKSATVPLCPGLTIVTAVSQQQGDYESIKTIESITPDAVRFRYSSYMPDPRGDYDHDPNNPYDLYKPPPWIPYTAHRAMLIQDLEDSAVYLQQFGPKGFPETVPGTTSLGISRRTFSELKAGKAVAMKIFSGPIDPNNPSLNIKDATFLGGEISLVDPKQTTLTVLVNGRPVMLPALHTRGKFLWDEGDFYFLDDETNPISLKFTIGNAAHPKRDNLLVIKINYDCASGPPPSGTLEKELADTGKADVYSIYFTFNSDAIRDESEPTMKNIADVLRRHPDWKIQINGHTDGVGGDQYNLDLSRRRAAAVKDSLVKQYAIDAVRLSTQGFGKSRPKDTNDTLEGRSRNRRVELIKQS